MFKVRCATCRFEDVKATLDAVLELQEAHQERLGDDHFIEFETIEEHSNDSLPRNTDILDRSVLDMVAEPAALVESLTDQLHALAEHYDEDESGIIAKAVEQGLEEMSRTMVIEQYEADDLTRDEVVEALGRDVISDLE